MRQQNHEICVRDNGRVRTLCANPGTINMHITHVRKNLLNARGTASDSVPSCIRPADRRQLRYKGLK
ncbi:unnamed protein product [Ectocarpus sp. CCAP 1310/34]|nr:unnamed protein product [Ectocarpus sp. CCAP 1310/34]